MYPPAPDEDVALDNLLLNSRELEILGLPIFQSQPLGHKRLGSNWRMTAEEFLQHYQAGERYFRGVKLSGIVLRDMRLSGLNLSCADLRGASLMGVDLSQANLSRADLSNAFLILTRLSDSNLTQANFSSAFLILADLQRCCLHQANFTLANLTKANLLGAIEGSTAVLTNATLTGARLPQPVKPGLLKSIVNSIETCLLRQPRSREFE